MEFFRRGIKQEQIALLIIMLINLKAMFLYSDIVLEFNSDTMSILTVALKSPIYYFSVLIVPMSIITLLGLLKNKYLRRVLVGIVLGFYLIIFVVDVFLWQNFGGVLDQNKLEILLTTDTKTSIEFLSLYVGYKGLIILLLIAAASYIFIKKLKTKLEKIKWLIRVEGCVLAISLVTGTIFWGSIILGDVPITSNFRLFRIYNSTSILRLYQESAAALKSLGNEQMIMPLLDEQKNMEDVSISDDVPYVIFILGESTDRNKMSAYGYKNDTTPLLNKRIASGETVLFTDTIACANSTRTAMSRIFSFADKTTQSPWYENGCMIDIFNKAGFYTSYLSNQSPSDRYGNMDGVLAKRSSEFAFTSSEGSGIGLWSRPYDSELLPLLDNSLEKNTNAKSFYTIHLTGTHESFKLRFPKEFARFTADEENAPDEKWREMQADYDNAVLFNDYIVDEIIKRFADKNAVLIYLSDHGNDVYNDDMEGFVGHSSEDKRSPHMIEIPMLVWGSNSFWSSHSELKQELIAAKDRPYSTENVIHFIFDLAGIKTSSYDSKKSILNPDNIYQHQPRMYGGVPYHKE